MSTLSSLSRVVRHRNGKVTVTSPDAEWYVDFDGGAPVTLKLGRYDAQKIANLLAEDAQREGDKGYDALARHSRALSQRITDALARLTAH